MYINRELSWLEFNRRVLKEAQDESLPLLERLKFLAITASNLDEFFMVRVGGLQFLDSQGSQKRDPSGLTAAEQLEAISNRTHDIISDLYKCLQKDVGPSLEQTGMVRMTGANLLDAHLAHLEKVFEEEIFPVFTPMAVESTDEFPLLEGLTLNLCVRLPAADEDNLASRYAVIPFNKLPHRFITLPAEGGYTYILLEDVLEVFIDRFFVGEEVLEVVPFRLTRNADLELREDQAADLLKEMSDVIDARKASYTVRLEIADSSSTEMLEFLQQSLAVTDQQTFQCQGPLDLADFMQFSGIHGFDLLKYPEWSPVASPRIDPTVSMFETIKSDDVLLYHPYHSFEPVLRFIEEAADDPDVLAIKQTLYRTSRHSPIIQALKRAANKGKVVTVLVEVKARFDEERNIEWARQLEQIGVQVIYGIKGLKTHAKICIVIRRGPQGIERFAHFGTGNYNESTARLYADISYMTCKEEITADATSFFNSICGYSKPLHFRKLVMAPLSLRKTLLQLIESETERIKQGQQSEINLKLNSLVDPKLIDALYAAAQAGVTVRLNVRGICCLNPGAVSGAKIQLTSIIDRYLEHARILHFTHGGDNLVFISSADWMPRNLDRRIELLVPIEDETCRDLLISYLKIHFQDNVKSHQLRKNGSYRRVKIGKKEKPLRSQEKLYQVICQELEHEMRSRSEIFEPHRPPSQE